MDPSCFRSQSTYSDEAQNGSPIEQIFLKQSHGFINGVTLPKTVLSKSPTSLVLVESYNSCTKSFVSLHSTVHFQRRLYFWRLGNLARRGKCSATRMLPADKIQTIQPSTSNSISTLQLWWTQHLVSSFTG